MTAPAVVVTGTIYDFLIFPNISDYPLFIVSLSPVVVITCWLIKTGRGPMGVLYGVTSILLISPANVQTLDPHGICGYRSIPRCRKRMHFPVVASDRPRLIPVCVVFVWLWRWAVPCAKP